MTDLQLMLIGGGGVFILFIIIYNYVRARRLRKAVEPDHTQEEIEAKKRQDYDAIVARLVEEEESHPVQKDPAILKMKELPADDLIECVIPITPEENVPSEKILPLLQAWTHEGTMPVRFVGLTEDANGEKNWHNIQPGKVYSQFRACVQLADIENTLTEIEFSSLIAQLNHISVNINADMEVPDMPDKISQAEQLHHFISTHDAQIRLNIQSNGEPWSRRQVQGVLEQFGYQSRDDGTWAKNDTEEGEECELFLLGTVGKRGTDTVSHLVLYLDVPCVPREKDPFWQMVSCAQRLCDALDGTFVDGKGNVVNDQYAQAVANQLDQYYQVMQAASLHAGSLRALRLYR